MVPVGYADPSKALPELSAKLRTCTSLGYFVPVKQPTWPGANCIPVWQDSWYVRWLSSRSPRVVCAGSPEEEVLDEILYHVVHPAYGERWQEDCVATVLVHSVVEAGPEKTRNALAHAVLLATEQEYILVDARENY